MNGDAEERNDIGGCPAVYTEVETSFVSLIHDILSAEVYVRSIGQRSYLQFLANVAARYYVHLSHIARDGCLVWNLYLRV